MSDRIIPVVTMAAEPEVTPTVPRDHDEGDDEESERRLRLQRRTEAEALMEQMLLEQEEEEEVAPPFDPPQEEVPQQQEPLVPPPPASPPFSKSWLTYPAISYTAAAGMCYYALRSRRQYYLAVVYLSSSKWACVIFGNALVAACMNIFTYTTNLFLGGLRLHEAEGLQDFFRWHVTETCFALTMFRNELHAGTALEFLGLILLKCLHHTAVSRESHVRMTEDAIQPTPSGWPGLRKSHVKLLAFLGLLQMLDVWVIQSNCQDIMARGPSVSILFAFEAAILLVSAWSHILLWHLHVMDGWLHYCHERGFGATWLYLWKEYKATMTFAVELQAQTVQFLFYLTFFAIVLTYYGMPINLFREVYLSFSQLKERLAAFMRYRQLMASMNRFDNATAEDLEESNICIICRDEMNEHNCKLLPGCRHTFHTACLREWLVQQQSCPTCRSDIRSMQAQERAAAQAQERAVVPPRAIPDEATEAATDENARDDTDEDSVEIVFEGDTPHEGEAPAVDPIPQPIAPPPSETKAAAEPALVVPALYRVKAAAGATVMEGGVTVRMVPCGTIVFCLKHTQEAGISKLRLPDGWILADEAELAHTLAQSQPTPP